MNLCLICAKSCKITFVGEMFSCRKFQEDKVLLKAYRLIEKEKERKGNGAKVSTKKDKRRTS